MAHDNLLDFLTNLIAEQLARQAPPPHQPKPGTRNLGLNTTRGGRQPGLGDYPASAAQFPTLPPAPPTPSGLAQKIATGLLEQALKSNLSFDLKQTSEVQLKGGNTAGAVTHITLHLPFVFKFEINDKTVREEARTMRDIKNNPDLAQDFRNAWATVYAIYEDGPPYAYLMEYFPAEDGWQSLENRLYATPRPSNANAIEWINAAVNLMFAGYESSVAARSRPNLFADYGSRLAPRLLEAEKLGLSKGNLFTSRPLSINGTHYKPWREYLALLERHADYLNQITPTFATVVHGDPNPGNFMLKLESGKIAVKLIDPKDWEHGDYLLDIAKLSHFLQIIGPTEYAENGSNPTVTKRGTGDGLNDELVLEYSLQPSTGVAMALEGCMDKVRHFAKQQGDTHWEARYELAMAANLLGLPVGRLKKDRLDAALIFLCEGIKWLDAFCDRLEPGFRHGKCVVYVAPDTFEPESFQQERARVQQRIANADAPVITSRDMRAYERLQWYFTPTTAAATTCTLMFEHQAHLCCGPALNIGTLQSALAERARTMQPFLADDNYRSWRITLCEQDLPLVRRYYDHADSGGALIRSQISLAESVASHDNAREWELELPWVALGATGIRARQVFQWEWEGDWQETLAIYKNPLEAAEWARHPLAMTAERLEIEMAKLAPVLQQSTYRETYLVRNAIDQAKFALHVDHVMVQDLKSGRVGTFAELLIDTMGEMNPDELAQFARFVAALVKEYGLVHAALTRAQSGIGAVGMAYPR